MHTEWNRVFEQIEAKRNEVLERVHALTETERSAAPKPGEWSPLQLVHHLVIAEGEMATQIQAATSQTTARPKPLSPMMVGFLCRTMRAGITLPAPPNMVPPAAPDPLPDLETRWNTLRQNLQTHLEAATATRADNRPFAIHPLLGPLTAQQALEITDSHLTYHLKRFPGLSRTR